VIDDRDSDNISGPPPDGAVYAIKAIDSRLKPAHVIQTNSKVKVVYSVSNNFQSPFLPFDALDIDLWILKISNRLTKYVGCVLEH